MEFEYPFIESAANARGYHERAVEYGSRAHRIKGQDVDVVYWDVGNSWSGIISVVPHDGDESHIVAFWNRLLDIVEQEEE